MKKQLHPYIFAGLDFMIDKDNNIVFLEANSNPGLMMVYKKLYGNFGPVDKFIDALKNEKKIIFIYSHEYVESESYGYTFAAFRNTLGKKCRQIVLRKKQMKEFALPLKDIEGNIIHSGTVWNSRLNVKRALSKNKDFRIINTADVCDITIDKFKTHEAVRRLKGVKILKTFAFSKKNEALDLVQKNNLEKFVIKPRKGTGGKNVFIMNSVKELEKKELSEGQWILQEKVDISKEGGKFWDIRVFVVNGKYAGAVKRISKNPVVNVSLGGATAKVEKSLQKRLAPVAEKCVEAIARSSNKKTAY